MVTQTTEPHGLWQNKIGDQMMTTIARLLRGDRVSWIPETPGAKRCFGTVMLIGRGRYHVKRDDNTHHVVTARLITKECG